MRGSSPRRQRPTLGEYIRDLRVSVAYTQREMAYEADVQRETWWRWEQNRTVPAPAQREAIIHAFREVAAPLNERKLRELWKRAVDGVKTRPKPNPQPHRLLVLPTEAEARVKLKRAREQRQRAKTQRDETIATRERLAEQCRQGEA